jgi:1-acyl-sn-glycerol-3-phosphate acyltransferase
MARDITYPIIIAAAKAWFRVGAPRSTCRAPSTCPPTGGAVIACNHNS